tara:strand:- start:192291 stop:193004 length:714 start_codon:yes stop_codon:yes gene_type:complete
MANSKKHIAFIMDGNGRWATARGLQRLDGHRQGANTVEAIVKAAPSLGIGTLTFYAFSSENWKRPEEEVVGLMDLLKIYFTSKVEKLASSNIRLRVFGDKSLNGKLAADVIDVIKKAEEATVHCTGLNVNFCVNYGGRDEIIRAAQEFSDDVEKGLRYVGDLDETLFSAYLDSRLQDDPDIIIRTGGDKRISNFLLWQCAYSELEFSDVSWPEFTVEDLRLILQRNETVERRYGGLV